MTLKNIQIEFKFACTCVVIYTEHLHKGTICRIHFLFQGSNWQAALNETIIRFACFRLWFLLLRP